MMSSNSSIRRDDGIRNGGTAVDDSGKLPERYIIEAFHVLAREAMKEAQQDRLIDEGFVSSASAEELQVLGPSLTLLFAAWKSTTDPPSVSVPASPTNPAFALSIATCPTALLPLLRRWQRTVSPLQRLSTEQAHDVARLICDLEPVTSPVSTLMVKLAADIQSVAIQISQRKTFLERYTQDLEIGLHRRSPSFQRPPGYAPESSTSGSARNDTSSYVNRSENINSAAMAAKEPPPLPHRRTPSNASMTSQTRQDYLDVNLQPPIPETDDPGTMAVRETLYSVLADVLSTSETLPPMMKEDPARGYFTVVALAIIEAALKNITPDGERVRVVSLDPRGPSSFSPYDAPPSFRVFVRAIVSLGGILRQVQERDNERAIELAMADQDDDMSLTRIEMLKQEIEFGVPDSDSIHESESQHLRETAELRTIANQINRMALAVTSLPGFKERTGVFNILLGVSRLSAL